MMGQCEHELGETSDEKRAHRARKEEPSTGWPTSPIYVAPLTCRSDSNGRTTSCLDLQPRPVAR